MDKKEAQDLTKAICSLVTVFKEMNKNMEQYTKSVRDTNETVKALNTRLGSLANSISDGGSIVNP